VRRAILAVVVAVSCSGCSGAHVPTATADAPAGVVVEPSASPFFRITAGPVHALVPDGWRAVPAGTGRNDFIHGGFIASPEPHASHRMDGSTSVMAATWIDATRVGVPSDFYYLAATGPLLSRLTHSRKCRAESKHVFLDDRPAFFDGPTHSAGDYMARGEGTCTVGAHSTRWAYFVAAPGFGPVRRIGIPGSGLYVVVAVMRDSAPAAGMLHHLIANTSFAGVSVPDFLAAAAGVVRTQ
jgi:hypothetical protein